MTKSKRIMKYSLSILLFLVIALALSSCQSKEEKAAELIKNELSKTLYDFQSYEPIETTVNEAKLTVYNDSSCFQLALAIAYSMEQGSKAAEEAKDASDRMDIWGPPTYYSSSYSDKQYYKYRDEAKDKYAEALASYAIVKTLGVNLEDSIKALEENRVIGWEVRHRFRCKTKGGQNTIGDYRYILDPKMKTVFFREDMDDQDYRNARNVISEALKGNFSNMNINN